MSAAYRRLVSAAGRRLVSAADRRLVSAADRRLVSATGSLLRAGRGERRGLALSVALAAGATAAGIALLATSGYLISRAAQQPPILMLMVAIVAVRSFGIARAGLRYLERLVSHDHALHRLARLRGVLFARLAPLLPGRSRHSGDLLSRFVADVDTLADLHPRATIPLLLAACAAPCAGVAAWALLAAAGPVVAAAIALPAIALPLLAGLLAVSAARSQAQTRARLTSELIQGIDGAAELAVAGRSASHAQRIDALDAELARLSRRDAAVSAAATALGGLLTGVGVVATLAVGIAAVSSGQLSGVLLAALVLLVLGAAEVLDPLPEAARRLHSCSAAAERVQEIVGDEPEVCDPPDPVPVPRAGALQMSGVRFRYGPGERWVLDGADLTVAEGERVALVGESGSGKSTIAELLVRFHDPDGGAVTLGGLDLRALAQERLREEVLLCGQDAHLFNTTVRENLLLARRDASDEQLLDALATVQLDEWVEGLPAGLHTFVGQDGEQLSGGQRRRLALARALLSCARFLILDEPTAHLDAPLARQVMSALLTATSGRGLLVVTHASEPELSGFDSVVALQRGLLAKVGEHDLTAAQATPRAALEKA